MLEGHQIAKPLGVFLVIVLLIVAIFTLFPSQAPAEPNISWTPSFIDETLNAGESKPVSVSFVATENITNANVRVVPELQPYVGVNPSSFGNIAKGQIVQVAVSIETDVTELPRVLDGTIQLRGSGGNKNFAKPLPVFLTIIWNSYIDKIDRYQIEHPAVLQPIDMQSVRPNFLHGIVLQSPFEMLNLSIAIYENASFMNVDEWYSTTLADREYSFPDGATRSTAPILVNGIPSLEVNSTILGFIKRRIFIPHGDRVIGLESSIPDNAVLPTAYFEMLNSFSVF